LLAAAAGVAMARVKALDAMSDAKIVLRSMMVSFDGDGCRHPALRDLKRPAPGYVSARRRT
jgi:hypothetical protein